MSLTYTELTVAQIVDAETEVSDEYTPPNGSKVWVTLFHGEAAFTINAACKLIWDFGGAGETVIWSTKGSGKMPFEHEITDADGVKKLAVTCDNGHTGELVLSAHARVQVTT